MTGNNSMIFKIFDQAIDQCFELHVIFIKNKNNEEPNSILLEPWEMRMHFTIPSLGDLESIDIAPIFYREMKRSDIANVIEINTSYDCDKNYIDEVITFKNEPIKFRKFFNSEGFKVRLNLNTDHEFQEETHEYSILFKDVKYLDTLVDKMKLLLRDSSYSEMTIETIKENL